MRIVLALLGVSVLAAVLFTAYQSIMGFGGEERVFDDFTDNPERLAFLREKGFLVGESCAPQVLDLEYAGFQDHWITFVLSDEEASEACHTDPNAVLPRDEEDSMWKDCSQFKESAGQVRYTCSNN